MEGLGIYFLLLIAVIAGWVLGRLSAPGFKAKPRDTNDIFADYFVGLNFLLNDEPDEAIDTFIKALEINSETVETHLALGALLRRRGKVDKAIKVHQALLARPGLDKSFSDSTRLQLAIDYISAGLLDRAERLLKEVLGEGTMAQWEALKHLIIIYQTEKEWHKAINCCSQLLSSINYKRDSEIRAAAAHYCCELAEQSLDEEQNIKAKEQIKKAFTFDRKNVRASLLLAKIEQRLGNYKAAIKELVRIRTNNPEFISQVLGPLAECYEQIHNMPEYEKLLTNTLPEEPDVSVVLALSDLVKNRAGDEAAIEFLNDYLTRKPSLTGLVELLKLQIPRTDAAVSSNLNLLQQMIDKLVRKNPVYQCNHCGYESRSLYWLCPSCQKWDRIKPILEAGGA
ncbi:MAG: lipopolysaccharide assembly protein LapB [Gammaproteobacteria bacterium]|nr:lipopolysaccharide assembly protein LapB [Gammaproteobacteria bacterium]MDD9959989.1 lipopolysaccharide assembly protein LapB [Gammaproteobacteria bacterium]